MKKIIISIFILISLFPLVYAGTDINMSGDYSTNPDDYFFWDNGDEFKFGATRTAPADGDALTTQGWTTGSTSHLYTSAKEKLGNMSIDMFRDGTDREATFDFGSEQTNITFQVTLFDDKADTAGHTFLWGRADAAAMIFEMGPYTGISDTKYYYSISGLSNQVGPVSREDGGINFTIHVAPSGSYMAMYFNRTLIVNDTSSDGLRSLRITQYASQDMDTQLDDLMIWSGSPEDRPAGGPPLDTVQPSISVDYPVNGSGIDGSDYEFYINGTALDDTAIFSVFQNNSLWGNNSGTNESWSFLNISLIPEGIYHINITVNDTSGNEQYVLSNFTVDYSAPVLVKYLPVGSEFTASDGIDINISATDTYEIFSYNLTCLNSSLDHVLEHYIEDLNVSVYAPKVYFNWSNHTFQTFDCFTQVYDSHTLFDIPEAAVGVNPFDRSLSLGFGKDSSYFRLETASDLAGFQSITYEKERDSYSYCFKFNDDGKAKARTFIYGTDSRLFYKSNSKYRGHFVSVGGIWKDLEGPTGSYTVERIDDYSFRIIEYTDTPNLCYSSQGILNYASLNFSVYKKALIIAAGGGGAGGSGLGELTDLSSRLSSATFRSVLYTFLSGPSFKTLADLIDYPFYKIGSFLSADIGSSSDLPEIQKSTCKEMIDFFSASTMGKCIKSSVQLLFFNSKPSLV